MVIGAQIEASEVGDVSGQASGQYRFVTRFEMQPDAVAFRAQRTVGKPRDCGPQTAIVTSDGGNELWCDEFGRVKIRFYWDREWPDDQTSSCWVRVSSAWAGQELGNMTLPREGQEVVVSFVDGDPDRPLITGRMYNPANMPPWELNKNLALAGYRSKEIGEVRANMLVFDDTPRRIQTQLGSDEGDSGLRLGWITRIAGNAGRAEERGRGFELATQLWGVMRAMQGLALLTDASPGMVKDMQAALTRLGCAIEQHQGQAALAKQHQAQDGTVGQHDAAQTIGTQNAALKGGKLSLRNNPFPEMTRPDLMLGSAAGIATTAADSTHQASGNDHSITAGRDYSAVAGRHYHFSAQGAYSAFAYNIEGMKFYAAQGPVQIQAQGNEINITSQKDTTIKSVAGNLVFVAKKKIGFYVGGTYYELTPQGIVMGTVGPWVVYAANHALVGPQTKNMPLPALPAAPFQQNPVHEYVQTFDISTLVENMGGGEKLAGQLYRVYLMDGTLIQQGMLIDGSTIEVRTKEPVEIRCEIGAGSWDAIVDGYNTSPDDEFDDDDEDAEDYEDDESDEYDSERA